MVVHLLKLTNLQVDRRDQTEKGIGHLLSAVVPEPRSTWYFLSPVPSDHSDLIADYVLSGSVLQNDLYKVLARYPPTLYSKIGREAASSTAPSVGHAPLLMIR